MSNKLVKENKEEAVKESFWKQAVKHLMSPAKGSTRPIPNWYWYLFLVVVVYSLFKIKI